MFLSLAEYTENEHLHLHAIALDIFLPGMGVGHDNQPLNET